MDFTIGVILAFAVAYISYRVRFLSSSGAIATFLLASVISGLGGIKWSVPILTFFILSSILSKLRKRRNAAVEFFFEKSGVRDHFQVLANGGLGGVLIILYSIQQCELYYLIYLASLSAVCADTWATEIGTWKKNNTYNILNLQTIEQGSSGGISIIGSMGALAGSITITLSGIVWIEISYIQYVILILSAGLLGSFFDSILGATVQEQYKCSVCKKVTEKQIHCGIQADHFKGYSWINNDMVNFFSGLSGALIIIILKNITRF